jgi:hypothetical protein
MIRRWKQWRQRRREELTVQSTFDLREFVYLDEVSVTSLLSSRLGKVPSEFTDTLTDSTKAVLNSNIAANAAVVKSSVGSRLEANRTEDTKVLSKATIQATFKRLFEGEEGSLALKPVPSTEPSPAIEEARKIITSEVSATKAFPWRVPSEQLKRGQLVEVEVELQADPTFRISTIIATFAELAKESKALRAYTNQRDFENAIELNKVLEKLMVGLVPLRCRVSDYLAVTIDQHEYLIHRRALTHLPAVEAPSVKEIFLVGVVEESLFWKDIRRVLFSKSRFRILCRLNHEGLDVSWTPVKLVDILGEVAPDLERQLSILGPGALKAMTEGTAAHGKFIEPRLCALTTFGELLARLLGIELEEVDRRRIETIAGETADLVVSVPESRKAFTQIADLLVARTSGEVDPKTISQLRVRACEQHGLFPGGSSVRSETVTSSEIIEEDEERFIDAEIIAIYW